MLIRLLGYSSVLLLTGAIVAGAHQGVTNPTVLARMEAMKSVADQMKTLGAMAKGEADFDPAAAQRAGRALSAHAAAVPDLFEARETDPRSEAAPEIWTDWDDFLAKTQTFQQAASRASEIASPRDLRAAMGQLGSSCKSCHETYRIEK
jgi:cytochrome c556